MEKLLKRNQLGKTGIEIPLIIFGTSALGNLYEALDENTKCKIVSETFEHVKEPVVFDSAGKYGAGLALETLGKCLKTLGKTNKQVIISNKLGWLRVPLSSPEPTFEKGVWIDLNYDAVQIISYDGMMQCWQQGNKLLDGYIPQLVSVHDPDEYLESAEYEEERKTRYSGIIDAYRALADLKVEGQVKAVGIGSKDWKMIQRVSNEVELDWVMFANSLTIYRHPKELVDFMDGLQRQKIGMINSAVFNAGFLIGGKYFDYKPIKPDSPENKAIYLWREKFMSLCDKHQIHPSDACIVFGMSVPGTASISLNTSNPLRIKENVKSVTADIDERFWIEMKDNGLIRKDYPYLGN